MRFKDLTGQRFGKLKVLALHSRGKPRVSFLCQCECGVEKVIQSNNLTSGNSRSCGCENLKAITKHGRSGDDPTYKSWENMRERVRRGNLGNPNFKWYKGIPIAPRWDSFENFLDDMGERPNGYTLDRIDAVIGYGPTNCRWATPTQQSRNTNTKVGVSGHRGVISSENGKKWMSSITVKRERIHLGTFSTIEQAVDAREQAEIKYWGCER